LETSHFAGICHPERTTTTQIYFTGESLSKKVGKKSEKVKKVEKNWTSVKVGWKHRILPEFVIRNERQQQDRFGNCELHNEKSVKC
jgi:hypothetical protein